MVTIQVDQGYTKRNFHVYKNLISAKSEFINNALKGDWRESKDRLVELPEFSSEDFEVYHVWLLTGRLHCRDGDKDYADQCLDLDKPEDLKDYEGSLWWEMDKLGNLSDLGHYLLDTDFTDTVSDAMIQCMIELHAEKCPFPVAKGPDMIAKLPESSPTRKLIFDLVAWTTDEAQMRRISADLRANPTEEENLGFMIGVSMAMTSKLTSSTPPPSSPLESWKSPETACKYHSHGKGNFCYIVMKSI
jgi:hypothetical protein